MSDDQNLVDPGPLVSNYESIRTLQRAILSAPRSIGIIEDTLKVVLHQNAWMDQLDAQTGQRYRFTKNEFKTFITSPINKGGLSSDEETLTRLLAGSPVLVDFLQALKPPNAGGGNHNPMGINQHTEDSDTNLVGLYNVQTDQIGEKSTNCANQQGNSTTASIRRLTKAAEGNPDPKTGEPREPKDARSAALLDEIRAGTKSPHRAMIEAGFRKEKTPAEQVRHWWKKLTKKEKEAFIAEVGKEGW